MSETVELTTWLRMCVDPRCWAAADEINRLQAVVEIAWNLSRYFEGREGTLTDEAILHLGMLRSKLHTLDGEP